MSDKKSTRTTWLNLPAVPDPGPRWGKAAQKLRAVQAYREAATVFATLSEPLHQARINCLVDGKDLVMPGPSIRAGFYLLPARSLPFRELAPAVTGKGIVQKGRLLKIKDLAGLSVALLLTGSLAVDEKGGRIGDGHGFFDLCCALLGEFGALPEDWRALTFIREDQLAAEPLPQDDWDIKMAGAVTPAGIHAFEVPVQRPRIFWEALSLDRIRRIDPLWRLYREMHPE